MIITVLCKLLGHHNTWLMDDLRLYETEYRAKSFYKRETFDCTRCGELFTPKNFYTKFK